MGYNDDKYAYEVDTYHTFECELDCTYEDLTQLLWISNQEHFLKNYLKAHIKKQYKLVSSLRKYKHLKIAYSDICKKQENYKPEEQEYKDYELKKKEIGSKLNKLYKQYHLTSKDICCLAKNYSKRNPINSVFVLSTAEDICKSLDDLLYGSGKQITFESKKNDQPSIRAKQINRGLILKVNSHDKLVITVGTAKGSSKKNIILKLKPFEKHDFFLMEELEKTIFYLKDPNGLDKAYKAIYEKTNEKQETHRPCFAKIVFKKIRHKTRVYIQFTIVGAASIKKDRHGNLRHHFKNGKLGFDLNVQTADFVGKDYVYATNLAERNGGHSTKDTLPEIKKLQKAMGRSLHATNSQNYNTDGAIKKGKKTWIKSNHYKQLEYKLHEQYRRDALFRLYANREIANDIREHGNVLITENNNISSWAKRSKKETKTTDKTIEIKQKDGTVKIVKKKQKKKRMGTSIQHRNPGGFMKECEKKFDKIIYVEKMFRASQFDHICGQYIKKKLSDRRFMLANGVIVQRDLYSAFLLYCANLTYEYPDRNLCFANFDNFYNMFLEFEKYVSENNIKIENYY